MTGFHAPLHAWLSGLSKKKKKKEAANKKLKTFGGNMKELDAIYI